MNKREEEHKIMEEIVKYAYGEMKYDTDEDKIRKTREWIEAIVKQESKEIGYKTQVIYGNEIDIKPIVENEENELLVLRFARNNMKEEKVGYFKDISKETEKNRVFEIDFDENYTEYAFKNYKNTPIDPFVGIMDNVFNELHHMRQYLMAKTGISSYLSLIFAKEYIINEKIPEVYKKNHNLMKTQEEARIKATRDWKEVYKGERRLRKQYLSFNEMNEHRDDLAFNMFDELMKEKENRYLLKEFPVLRKEYNEDGTKKSLKQLLENMKLEVEKISQIDRLSDIEKEILIKDCKEMYFEILYREMQKEPTIEEITSLAEEYNEQDNTLLFSEMKLSFKERYEKEKQEIEETGLEINNKEQLEDIKLRGKYYQSRIGCLKVLIEQQKNEGLINHIIRKGETEVKIRNNKFLG